MANPTTPKPEEDVIVGATQASVAPPPESLPDKGLGTGLERSDRYPPGIPYIVGNEGAERFSFYGMKAILYVYMVALFIRFLDEGDLPPEQVAAAKARGTQVTHLFVAGVYMFPLIGAVISDRLLGKYRTILWISLIYCAGHLVLAVAGRLGEMAIFGGAELGMYVGLALIAVGSGGIKPCVSAHVGDQFGPENGHLVTKIFQIFYFIINFGSFISTLLIPWVYVARIPVPLLGFTFGGAEWAFGIPGLLMIAATFVFWLGRNKFVHVPPKPGGKLGLLDTLVTCLLFTPLFAFIVGYFVLWESFVEKADHAAQAAGAELTGHGALIAPFFASNWWLLASTAVAFALGVVFFQVRQRIKEDSTSFLPVLIWSFRNQKLRKPGQGFFDPARERFGEETGDGPPAVLKVVVVFSMVSFFWALFDQHASTWVEQAGQMNRVLTLPYWSWIWIRIGGAAFLIFSCTWLFKWISNNPLSQKVSFGVLGAIGGVGVVAGVVDLIGRHTSTFEMEAAQISFLNPVMVMMIIPLLNILVYTPLKNRGIDFKPLQRMTLGMFMAAAAFVAAALLQVAVEARGSGSVHVLWQILPYFIMTTAEVLVSITGLEFAYTQAPRSMKSTMMGFWLFFVALGNLIVAFLAPLQKTYELSQFFWIFAGLMAVAALIFSVLAYFYKGKSYLQETQAS